MNERKVIAAALAVIAATMVVNVFARTERSAEAQTVTGPVEPTVVAGAVFPLYDTNGDPTNTWHLFRLWSDGAVDLSRGGASCTPVVTCAALPILPGSCASDITRNGDVDFPDLLGVLNDWGPCPEKP